MEQYLKMLEGAMILRRLLRRASRMGRKLNINREFLSDLIDIVVENYKEIYPISSRRIIQSKRSNYQRRVTISKDTSINEKNI